jgi:hypothetical protein
MIARIAVYTTGLNDQPSPTYTMVFCDGKTQTRLGGIPREILPVSVAIPPKSGPFPDIDPEENESDEENDDNWLEEYMRKPFHVYKFTFFKAVGGAVCGPDDPVGFIKVEVQKVRPSVGGCNYNDACDLLHVFLEMRHYHFEYLDHVGIDEATRLKCMPVASVLAESRHTICMMFP